MTGEKQIVETEPSPEEPTEVVNPLVFQCKSCRVILGDSFSWLCADEESNTISLLSVPSTTVQLEKEMKFSTSGIDAGR
jgi:hypothetical protein